MNKKLHVMFLLAALLAIGTPLRAQGTITPVGMVSEKLSFSVGEVVVSERAGFWAVDATVASGVESIFCKSEVEIKTSADGGDIEIRIPQQKNGTSVAYSLYSIGGKLIGRERISGESTIVKTTGREPVILTVTDGGKPLTTVKILPKH